MLPKRCTNNNACHTMLFTTYRYSKFPMTYIRQGDMAQRSEKVNTDE